MTHVSKLTLLAASFVTWTLATPVKALECDANADCPKGYECQDVGTTDCPDIACVDSQPCEPVDCTSETFSECMPVECSSDDDCAEGMVCHQDTSTVCETSPCAAGEKCPDAESSCEEISRNYCVPKYLLPCKIDADCGPGFSCAELEECACSGGGGSSDPLPNDGAAGSGGGASDSDAGGDIPPPEQSCTCEPSGDFACYLEPVACEADKDCDDDFTCQDNPEGADCWASSDGQSGCTEPDPAKLCLPPYFDLTNSVARGESFESATDDAGGKGTGAAGDTGESDGESADDAGHAKRSSGCQLAGGVGGAPVGGSLVGLFALAAVALRRRPGRNRAAS
jgi:hypothetical protein